MRVATVVSDCRPETGGVANLVVSLSQHFPDAGVDSDIWTTRKPGGEAALGAGDLVCRPGKGRWCYAPSLAREFRRRVSEYDVVHIHGMWSYPVWALAAACRAASVPYILSPHGTLRRSPLRHGGTKKLIYMRLIGSRLVRGARAVHVMSADELEDLGSIGLGSRGFVAAGGVGAEWLDASPVGHLADARWPELADSRVILALSRFSPIKGLDTLIEAWGQLRADNPQGKAMLVIAGADDRGYQAGLERLVDRLGLTASVKFLGFVGGEDKMRLIDRADVVVLPSRSENFGLVVVEALGRGVPVVASTGTPWRELVEHEAGALVEPSSDGIAAGLGQMLRLDDAARVSVGDRGRELVRRKYTWSKLADALAIRYAELDSRGA